MTKEKCPVFAMPATDVALVANGWWVRNEVVYKTLFALNFHCSVCGESAHTTRFCPHCGAKMDQETTADGR